MDEILYNYLTSYYTALSYTGYEKDSTVYKLLILCFYRDFMLKDYRGILTYKDYKTIEEVLDSFYGTNCLMSYPDYLKMGKLHLGEMTEMATRVKKLEDTSVVKARTLEESGDSDIEITEED